MTRRACWLAAAQPPRPAVGRESSKKFACCLACWWWLRTSCCSKQHAAAGVGGGGRTGGGGDLLPFVCSVVTTRTMHPHSALRAVLVLCVFPVWLCGWCVLLLGVLLVTPLLLCGARALPPPPSTGTPPPTEEGVVESQEGSHLLPPCFASKGILSQVSLKNALLLAESRVGELREED